MPTEPETTLSKSTKPSLNALLTKSLTAKRTTLRAATLSRKRKKSKKLPKLTDDLKVNSNLYTIFLIFEFRRRYLLMIKAKPRKCVDID